MAGKGSRTISMILAIIMVLGLFPSLGPSADAELLEFDPFSVTYGIPTTGLVDAPAGIPLLTETVPQHAHHFTYSAEGNTIVAHCDATDCPLENGEAKLVLKTPDAAKTDSFYAGASIQNNIPLSENAILGPVVYYVLNESELTETGVQPESFLTEENRLELAPKKLGTYLAAVTLSVDGVDYTVWNVFEIYLPKAALTVRPEPVEGLVYDGQPHALVTPGDAGGNAVLYAVLANDETEPSEGFDDTFPMAADAGLYVVWFRAAGDADHEDGDTDHVVVRIQKAAQAAPSAPEAEEITAESITLKASEGYEYSMDGENWQSDNTFGGLTANTEYRFFQRVTGDYNHEISPAGEAAVFRTLEAEEEPETSPVRIWFVCDPLEMVLTICSVAENSTPVSPEEDGSYLLLPGSWLCTAAADGYQSVENSEFTVSAENRETQYITLELQKLPPLVSPAFEGTAYLNGMTVRVSAPEGVFPEGSTLSVTQVPYQEQQFVDAAVDAERGEAKTVMASYTFDIKVIGPDGAEAQPADEKSVTVSFTANVVAEQNLRTDVYHVSGEGDSLSAERLDTTEQGATVTAETDGFSYYTVEFTYETLQYVLPGGESVALSEILNTVGLSGTVNGVVCSRPDLFSADTRSGEWVVYSHQPFTSTEWMKVVINGLEYTIIVTDAPSTKKIILTANNDITTPINEIVLDIQNRPKVFFELSLENESTPSGYRWSTLAAGKFLCTHSGNNGRDVEIEYKPEYTNNGTTLTVKLLDENNNTVAERTIPVKIQSSALPKEITVNPNTNPIVIVNSIESRDLKLYFDCNETGVMYDISLTPGGIAGFTTDGSNSLTITGLSKGTATLDILALKKGQTNPVARKTITIQVVEQNSSQPSSSNSNGGTNNPSGSSSSGGGRSTGGTTPGVPSGNGNTGKKLTPEEQKYQDYLDEKSNHHQQFWDKEGDLPKTVQLYKLKANGTYTDSDGTKHTRVIRTDDICNMSSYVTLINRFLAYYYPDKKYSATPEDVFKLMGEKDLNRYTFAGKDTYIYIKDDGKEDKKGDANQKTLKPASGNTAYTGYICNQSVTVPNLSLNFTNDQLNFSISAVSYAAKRNQKYSVSDLKNPANLAALLSEHPEGVYIRCVGSKKHAVIVSDYKYENGKYTFKIIDPSPNGTVRKADVYERTISKENGKWTGEIIKNGLTLDELYQVYTLKTIKKK